MRKRNLSLLAYISLVGCIQYAASWVSFSGELGRFDFAVDSESLLAQGLRIDFWKATVYDLELIPRISDKLARRILLGRVEMRAAARVLSEEDKAKALELARGIGPKSSRTISRFLRLGPYTPMPRTVAAAP